MSGWKPALAPERCADVIDIAHNIAVRIADAEQVNAALQLAATQASIPLVARWQPCSAGRGDAGLALTCGQLDRCLPDAGWDISAHELLASAAHAAAQHPPAPSLFAGLGGLGFVALMLARDGGRYGRLAESVDAALVPQASGLAQSVRQRRGALDVHDFDVISGLAGIGVYLLGRREQSPAALALERVLGALVDMVSNPPDGTPGWLTPHDRLTGPDASRYPRGNLNCGLAHGIPGPVALMALAVGCDVRVPGLRSALASAADWLAAHRCDDEWGVNWPAMVTVGAPPGQADRPTRSGWCYGAPGVARSLWLAGQALDDERLAALAVEAMRAVYRRSRQARQIDSPTFCHGVAGLLQVTLRFAHDTGLPVFTEAARDLTEQLVAAHEPASALGYRSIEPGGNVVDLPGLLDGAAGIALVLLAAACDVEPVWDRLFVLS